jgi:hypothetical protein
MTQDTDDFIETPEEAEQIESIRAWMTREGIGLDELIDLLDLYVPVTPPVYVPWTALSAIARLKAWVKRAFVGLRAWAKGKPDDHEDIRKELRDLIETISPSETPFFKPSGDAKQNHYEWQTEKLK